MPRSIPSRWFGVLLRLPVWLYRLHLGWLFGDRFLLLTHIGRRTGLRHDTLLEVLQYDRQTRTCIVASGWGEQSQWLKNIMAQPMVEVTLAMQKYRAGAQRISQKEAVQVLHDYSDRHPWAMRYLARWMLRRRYAGREDDFIALSKRVPLIALRFL